MPLRLHRIIQKGWQLLVVDYDVNPALNIFLPIVKVENYNLFLLSQAYKELQRLIFTYR